MPPPPQPPKPPHSIHHHGGIAMRYARGERPFLWPPMAEGAVEPTIEPNYEQEEIDRLDAINDAIGRLELTFRQGLDQPPLELPTPIYNPPAVNTPEVNLAPLLEMLSLLLNEFGDLRMTIEQRVGQDRKPSVVYGGGARQVGLLDINGNKINAAQEPFGTFNYDFGTAGTVTPVNGAKVRGIFAHATTAGTVNIFGKGAIPIPANTVFFDSPELLTGDGVSTIVLSGTDSYYVRYL